MQIVKNHKGKYNFIPVDKELSVGNVVSETWFNRVGPFNEVDKLAIIEDITDPKRFNLLRMDGTILSKAGFDKMTPPSEGFRQVAHKQEDETMKWTWINSETGALLSPETDPEQTIWVDGASEFSQGFASFKRGEKRNYVDTKGNILLENDVDETRNFENGVAVVGNEGKFNYIDAT